MANKFLKLLALDNSNPVIYELDIPPSEVRHRLEEAAEAEGSYWFVQRFPLRFKTEHDFQLTRNRNRNSWRRVLNASLQNHGNGTRLTGSFDVSGFVLGFTILWLLMAFGSTIMLLVQGSAEMIGSLIFPVLGIALPHIGRLMTRSDERAVLELLDKAFTGYVSRKDTPGY